MMSAADCVAFEGRLWAESAAHAVYRRMRGESREMLLRAAARGGWDGGDLATHEAAQRMAVSVMRETLANTPRLTIEGYLFARRN